MYSPPSIEWLFGTKFTLEGQKRGWGNSLRFTERKLYKMENISFPWGRNDEPFNLILLHKGWVRGFERFNLQIIDIIYHNIGKFCEEAYSYDTVKQKYRSLLKFNDDSNAYCPSITHFDCMNFRVAETDAISLSRLARTCAQYQ